eukprot:TRINITY_DN16446_c0_g2_i1.p2 TRINITY_DN16446_c0_g2~~TRINITY_DN16446_c0_g2_i1.p2  ORF type:complete len:143 (-),score=22.22 TRINITY_DN16446_c0_g2_i1:7-435(-)
MKLALCPPLVAAFTTSVALCVGTSKSTFTVTGSAACQTDCSVNGAYGSMEAARKLVVLSSLFGGFKYAAPCAGTSYSTFQVAAWAACQAGGCSAAKGGTCRVSASASVLTQRAQASALLIGRDDMATSTEQGWRASGKDELL